MEIFKIIKQIDPETNDPNVQHVKKSFDKFYYFIFYFIFKKKVRNIYIRDASPEAEVIHVNWKNFYSKSFAFLFI